MIDKCAACKYWSELITRMEGRVVQAICMSSNSAKSGEYTNPSDTCAHFSHGEPIDQP